MADTGTFIRDARKKGLTDEQIRKALTAQGWDSGVIDAGLAGLEVPKATKAVSASPSSQKRPSLSPLMAALHHVLLWFFAGSSTVTIVGVAASLTGYDVSSETLAAMIAVTVVTFIPYAVLFFLFLVKLRKNPELVPGKVWSIITICLYSVGTMAAAITLIVSIIVEGEANVQLGAALVLVLNLLIVGGYAFGVSSPQNQKLRRGALVTYLVLLALFFSGLFILSIMRFAPAKHDEALRENLASTVRAVHDYRASHPSLPQNGSEVVTSPEITYTPGNQDTYTVCATFQLGYERYPRYNSYREDNEPENDRVSSESQFYVRNSGHHCFDFRYAPISIFR